MHTTKLLLAIALLGLGLASCSSAPAPTADGPMDPPHRRMVTMDPLNTDTAVHIVNIHVNPAVQNAPSAAFVHLHNTADQDDVLLGASTEVAKFVEIHETTMENGMMIMTALDRILLPAKERVVFRHGGKHLMLIDLTRELRQGERIQMTLHFKNAGDVTMSVPVMFVAPNSQGRHQHHMKEMQDQEMMHHHHMHH